MVKKKDCSNMYLLGMVACVAIVALVVLVMNVGTDSVDSVSLSENDMSGQAIGERMGGSFSGSGSSVDYDSDGIKAKVDCDDKDASVGVGNLYYYDADGDGFGGSNSDSYYYGVTRICPGETVPTSYVDNNEDCDDANSDINPDAEEVCNGYIDDNCDNDYNDGMRGSTDLGTFYADMDNDGHGNPAGPILFACVPDLGYVEEPTDCDDSDASINPDAVEVCDGIDNDCDRLIDGDDEDLDESTGYTWYLDVDLDGYGDTSTALTQCDDPSPASGPGYVLLPGDCNDLRTMSNPDMPEYCNGVDDNCDGDVDEGC